MEYNKHARHLNSMNFSLYNYEDLDLLNKLQIIEEKIFKLIIIKAAFIITSKVMVIIFIAVTSKVMVIIFIAVAIITIQVF